MRGKLFALSIAASLLWIGTATAQKNDETDADWKACVGGRVILNSRIDVSACGRILATRTLKPDERAKVLDRRGARYLYDKKFAPAIADFTAALGMAGLTPETRISLHQIRASAHIAAGNVAAARDDHSAAVAIRPGETNLERGAMMLKLGRYQEARADADAALAAFGPSHYRRERAYVLRGQARHGLRDFAGARADFDVAIAADKYDAFAVLHRGEAFDGEGKHELALADYVKATTLAGRPAEAFNAACWSLAAKLRREFARAAGYCEEAIERDREDPFSEGVHTAYIDSAALVALQQGRWQDAWENYDMIATGAPPADAHTLYGRGLAALKLGKTVQGQADLAAAAKLDPGIAATYAGYGQKP